MTADGPPVLQQQYHRQRVFWCNGQGSYRHGATMCTTACMQVGMAMLCAQIDLGNITAEPYITNVVEERVSSTLNWCMNAASTVHGRIQTMLHRREQLASHSYMNDGGRGSCSAMYPENRMVSVNEVVTLLGINLGALGVCMEELVVCKRGVSTRLQERASEGLSLAQESLKKGRSLKYEAESCFVGLGHVPLCMELVNISRCSGGGGGGGRDNQGVSDCCVAFITANNHTVCAACYPSQQSGGESEYAFFDPSPGQLQTGMSAAQLVHVVSRTLAIPSSVCSSVEEVRRMAEECGAGTEAIAGCAAAAAVWKSRKKRGHCVKGEKGKTVTWAECLDSDGQPIGVQMMSRSLPSDEFRSGMAGYGEFQCDVTLMFVKS